MYSKQLGNLHIETSGPAEGPTIVLLHGVTRQIADLRPIIDRLPKFFGWIAVDFPGHGKSAPRNGEYKVSDYSADIVESLNEVSQDPLVLFGHSLGAMVAAQVASLLPQRIAGAILSDPPFSTMGSKIKESSFFLQFEGIRDLLWSQPDNETLFQRLRELPIRRASDHAIVRFCEVRDDASLQTYAGYLSQVDPRVLDPIVSAEWLDGYDLVAVAKKIVAPVLLLQAETRLGGLLTSEEAELFRSSTRDCRIKKFEGASHLIHATHADLLASEIDSFLKSLPQNTN